MTEHRDYIEGKLVLEESSFQTKAYRHGECLRCRHLSATYGQDFEPDTCVGVFVMNGIVKINLACFEEKLSK